MSFNLTQHVMAHPIADDAYMRHIRTADVFDAVQRARETYEEAWVATANAMRAEEDARKALKAEIAKAKLMAALEDL